MCIIRPIYCHRETAEHYTFRGEKYITWKLAGRCLCAGLALRGKKKEKKKKALIKWVWLKRSKMNFIPSSPPLPHLLTAFSLVSSARAMCLTITELIHPWQCSISSGEYGVQWGKFATLWLIRAALTPALTSLRAWALSKRRNSFRNEWLDLRAWRRGDIIF